MISIDSWIKKQKTYICMILVIGCFGSAEIVYSQNICIINDIDDFLLMNRLNTSQLSNEIRITSGKNTITAGQAIYDESGSSINVSGGVTLENSDLFIEGQSALINTNDETALLKLSLIHI